MKFVMAVSIRTARGNRGRKRDNASEKATLVDRLQVMENERSRLRGGGAMGDDVRDGGVVRVAIPEH